MTQASKLSSGVVGSSVVADSAGPYIEERQDDLTDCLTKGNLESIRQHLLERSQVSILKSSQALKPRDVLLVLVASMGQISFTFATMRHAEPFLPGWPDAQRSLVKKHMSNLVAYLILLSDCCGIDLGMSATRKMVKNAIKYPSALAKGSSAKYTEYRTSQTYLKSHVPVVQEAYSAMSWNSSVSIESLTKEMNSFASARDWNQFHSPRNLVLALAGEVGELCECFQWKNEPDRRLPDWPVDEKVHLGEELSDCLLYSVRLAERCGIDLTQRLTSTQPNSQA